MTIPFFVPFPFRNKNTDPNSGWFRAFFSGKGGVLRGNFARMCTILFSVLVHTYTCIFLLQHTPWGRGRDISFAPGKRMWDGRTDEGDRWWKEEGLPKEKEKEIQKEKFFLPDNFFCRFSLHDQSSTFLRGACVYTSNTYTHNFVLYAGFVTFNLLYGRDPGVVRCTCMCVCAGVQNFD